MDITLTREGIEAVEEVLLAAIDSEVPLLNDASRHILSSGGKHLRPHIALLSYLAVGGTDLQEAAPLAAAVEMVHTATLVHDDINDHSLLRRGRPSVHARWGRTFALLTGDYMFAKVYVMMAPFGPAYNVIMANACSQLVEGETLQAVAAKAGTIDRETYKRIVSLKTASLFEAAGRMGALRGGGEPHVVEALAEYAYNVGIAFQVIDDILDVIGNPEALGKPVGADVAQGRGAFVAQGAANHTGEANGRTILSLRAGSEPAVVAEKEADPIAAMMSKLRTSGAIELARIQAIEVVERARRALELVPPSAARDELERLTYEVIERDR
ncbi:polyprenyl synthetase family protein [Promineifilum sp.]|uniref:polyprenyl synthetase family protein n=1 Tax=Promineifilum sp. TaxID=2664178 RepID=UPI0035B14389